MTKELIQFKYPMASRIQINSALKYQDKFQLTLENLKCVNHDCKNMKKWFDTKNGFAHTCGNKECKEITKTSRYQTGSEKAKKTFISKYGVSNPSQLEEVKKAKKETCLKNSGFEHNMQNPEHIRQREAKSFELYDVSNPSKLEEVKDKLRAKKRSMTIEQHRARLEAFKKSSLIKFNTENPSQNQIVKQKVANTNFDRIGVTSPFLHPEIQKLIKSNRFNKTGYINPFSNPEIQQNIKEYYLQTFGCNSYPCIHIKNLEFWNNKDFWITNFQLPDLTINYLKGIEFFNCSISRFFQKLKEFGIDYTKRSGFSFQEKEIGDFIKDILNTSIIENQRFPIINELDIYIPDHNIAIEYNGIYWHSYLHLDQATNAKQTDLRYSKQRHKQKTDTCQANGIQLFHIFENEWQNETKQIIWKSMIENALGKSKRLGARKCILKQVPKKDIRPFLEENHLQGYGNSPIAYGLYYENELYSIMTFASGKGRMDKKTDWELIRFCNKVGYNVQGAASKLLKAFRLDHPGSIKSYANRRWSNGNLYRALGFKELGTSEPNHFYWHKSNPNNLIVRQQLQKHKLKNKLKVFDSTITAFENVTNAGYNIIWDAGNYVFLLPEEEYK